MANKMTATSTINIHAPLSNVWQALTDPALIKEYLFGTNTVSDWEKGSPITYTGVWEGKPYEDKGTIVEIIPQRHLHTTYFSGMSGKEDIPENYANVIYDATPIDDENTQVTITQDNIDNEQQLEHMKQNWGMVLNSMKQLLER